MGAALATREATVTLPDGRRLAWSSGGARGGVPVFYLHGAIGTPVRRTPELDALIAALGIHYIAVSRPGFGRSDPCPGRRIADFPADVEHLADRLGLGRFAVVGVSAGGPYALACARALPANASRWSGQRHRAPPAWCPAAQALARSSGPTSWLAAACASCGCSSAIRRPGPPRDARRHAGRPPAARRRRDGRHRHRLVPRPPAASTA
jgi:pimeloyl-ACP methyl ester carboxylesterase